MPSLLDLANQGMPPMQSAQPQGMPSQGNQNLMGMLEQQMGMQNIPSENFQDPFTNLAQEYVQGVPYQTPQQTPQQLSMFQETYTAQPQQSPEPFRGNPADYGQVPQQQYPYQQPQQTTDPNTFMQQVLMQNQNLQRTVELLAANQAQMQSAIAKNNVPEIAVPQFLKSADLDTVLNDPAQFEGVLQTVYQKALEAARTHYESSIPSTVQTHVQMQVSAQQALSNFFQKHPEYEQRRELVGLAVQAAKTRNPQIQDAHLLMQNVENILGLQGQQMPQGQQQYANPQHPYASQQSYGRPNSPYMMPQQQAPAFAHSLGGVPGNGVPDTSKDSNQRVMEFFMANHFRD